MWVPKKKEWKSQELTLHVEPYRFDLKLSRDSSGRFVEYDFAAGTTGVLYLVDFSITNHCSGPISVALSPKTKHCNYAGTFLVPRLEQGCVVRLRFSQFPGDMLEFAWWPAEHFSQALDRRAKHGSIPAPDLTISDYVFVEGENLTKDAPTKTTWKWLDNSTSIWNEFDLARRNLSSALPAEAGLEVASSAIVGALCRQPEVLKAAEPAVFESMIGALFREQGFTVKFTARGRDGGIDLLAVAGPSVSPSLHLIQCKRYQSKVGIRPVRELYGVREDLGASKAILVTPSSFTKPAIAFASEHPWEIGLLDWEGLLACLAECSGGKA